MSAFVWGALSRPLSAADRAALASWGRAALAWQRRLAGWPVAPRAPRGTPFVSLYARGRLRGCMGSVEGPPAERLARAFLLALADQRTSGIAPAEREELALEIVYPRAPWRLDPSRAEERFAPGAFGLALVRARGASVLLLPEVAREHAADTRALLEMLAEKAGVARAALGDVGAIYAFAADTVAVHARPGPGGSGEDAAAAWLARHVAVDGAPLFATSPRARTLMSTGPMRLGRAAVVLRALAEHGGHPRATARLRRWLTGGLPRYMQTASGNPAEVAGSAALAVLAGVPADRALLALARARAAGITAQPWHAAQVVAALGPAAPCELWDACARDLDARPWAPWTAIAARAMGDARVLARSTAALVGSIATRGPRAGAASVTPQPEIALTALVVEALAADRSPRARAAVRVARAFLRSVQIDAGRRAALDPALAHGAFPLTPVAETLRADVTAHALRALARS